MTFPKLNSLQVFSCLRVGCGVSLLLNLVFVQIPNFKDFFSSQGMINPQVFYHFSRSPLFYIWNWDLLKYVLLVATCFLACFFTVGLLARLVHLPLFLMTLFFQMANPLVIHEPQQLTQLLLLILWFVPYEQSFSLKKTSGFETYESMNEKIGSQVIMLLTLFLGFYYLLAGLKKLPDPAWIRGQAVALFVSSPYLGLSNPIAKLFLHPWLSTLASWGTLVFELGFLLVVWTRFRIYLLFAGITFHAANILVLDVGFFWAAMWMWYPLLLFKRDARKPSAL